VEERVRREPTRYARILVERDRGLKAEPDGVRLACRGRPAVSSRILGGTVRIMDDRHKTREQLLDELRRLRERLAELEPTAEERCGVENELRRERNRAERLLYIVDVILIVLNQAGEVTLINRKGCEVLGYSEEELLGKRWFDTCVPEAERGDVRRAFEGLMRGGVESLRYFRNAVRTKSGAERIVYWHNSVLRDDDGRIVGTLSSGQDITEREQAEQALRESEAKYRALFEAASDAVFLVEAGRDDVRFVDCNQRVLEVFGARREDVIGKSPVDFSPPTQPCGRSSLMAGMQRIRAALDGWPQFFEWRHRRLDGGLFDAEVTLNRVDLVDGIHLIGIVRDITRRKRAEDKLRRSREELRRLALHIETVREEERTNISREIHDELGQVLTALNLDLSWLAKKFPSGEDSLREKTEAMARLAESTIRTVKRISSELRPGHLDDLGLAASIQWLASEFEKRTGIRCDVEIEPREITIGRAYATALFRILQEALTNVSRHARARHVRIRLEETSRKIILRVRDDGTGIRREELGRPDSFGLMGMRERVHPWGGRIRIAGAREKGTLIVVELPVEGDA
jgi:PAS domain S-box-containing protein